MMYVAIMDSESFEWMALGTTEEEAREAILTAWNNAQSRLVKMDWEAYFYESVEALEEDYEIRIEELTPGQCVMR